MPAPELKKVLEILDIPAESPTEIRNLMIINLFFYTGIRPISLRQIRLCDIDPNGINITVKQGRREFVEVVPEMMSLILKFIENVLVDIPYPSKSNDEEWLFPSKLGSMLSKGAMSDIFIRQIGTDLTSYSFRKSLAQGMWDAGCPSNEIASALCHSDLESIGHYVTEVGLERARELLDSLAKIISDDNLKIH